MDTFKKLKYIGTFQTYIESIIASHIMKNVYISYLVSPMHVNSYKFDTIPASIQGNNISMYFILLGAMSMSFLIVRLQTEKTKKIREFMRIMGMTDTSYYLSYLFSYMISGFISILLVTICLKLFYLTQTNPLIIFVTGFLICLNTFSFALIIK